MGLFSGFKTELIDIIEWIDESSDTMVYRFVRHDNEIKNNAKLIVREGQTAVFIDQGKFADVFEPGTYTLSTENLPILGTLKGWKYGFDSPFKSEVYFLNTRRFTDLGWGTPGPATIRDPELGPVKIKAFGNFSIKITDAPLFIEEISGTSGNYKLSEINDQLRSMVTSGFIDAIAESKIPVIDLPSKYDELSEFLTNKLVSKFEKIGLEVVSVLIENIILPEEIQEAFDKKTSMNILGDLDRYSKYESTQAMRDIANNPSGGASEGVGLGMGFGMAQNMMQNMNTSSTPKQSTSNPPPLPTSSSYHYSVNGAQAGPASMGEIKTLIANKTIQRETLVWKQGMSAWQKADSVSEIALLFSSIPPPLPS